MGQSTILNKLMSSANILILVLVFFTISFINISNNDGPKGTSIKVRPRLASTFIKTRCLVLR